MKNFLLACSALSLVGGLPAAQAATATYNVTTTWYEPDTQPDDSIFTGSFQYDSVTHVISNLQGKLSESMSGTNGLAYPNDDMTWLNLTHQLVTWYDAAAGGTFAATFLNGTTATFQGGTWTPADGVNAGGTDGGYANAYALIFVPNNPTATLTQAQIDKLAYADCTEGGLMGGVCMTGTSIAGYGNVGTMSGIPVSQSIAAVPEPETYATLIAGLGLMGLVVRRRRPG